MNRRLLSRSGALAALWIAAALTGASPASLHAQGGALAQAVPAVPSRPVSDPAAGGPSRLVTPEESPAGASPEGAPTLTLAEAVERALASYPTVAAARSDLEGASAGVGQARAAFLPSLRADASLTRFEEPMVVAPLHGFDFRSPPEFNRTLVQGTLSLGYTLFDAGARGAEVGRARGERAATVAALDVTWMGLVQDVATSYLHALTLREVLKAQDRRLDALGYERDRARRFLEEGRAARVELVRAEAALSRAQADRVKTTQDLDVALADLGRLTGLGPAGAPPESLAPVRAADSRAVVEDSAARAAGVSSSPDVARARGEALAARAGRVAARAAWLPQLELLAGYVQRGSAAGDFSGEWQAGVQLGYPLFTGGRRDATVAGADAASRAADERLRATELLAEREVDHALGALREQRARLAALAASVEQSREVARIEKLALDAGRGTQTDYLAAEADLLDARAALVEARNAEVLARIRLARATGDLSSEWISRNLEGDQP